MVFSSVLFISYFLPAFFLVYYLLPRGRNLWLLTCSLLFYSWGELAYLPTFLFSLLMNYVLALLITSSRQPRLMLGIGVALNLLLLAAFKYTPFLDQNLGLLTGLHISGAEHFTRIPLGISFYTFQAMSYLIDVYRREVPAERNPLTVAAYISMFPQLVAGPIVRFHTVQRELHTREVTVRAIARGLRIFILGLASKVLLANTLAGPADAAFGMPIESLSRSLAWLGVVSYSLQIYFDFAGYSLMAIGLGLMMGFHFPRNFNHPYISRSVTEFWRRWHMSLSTWFRDYLYIPLGGNRRGRRRTYLNLMIVFLLCGVWHGANWTFVLWGMYHGFFLVIERFRRKNPLLIWQPFRHLYLLFVIAMGWVLFRSDTLGHASSYFGAMFSITTSPTPMRLAGEWMAPDVTLALCVGLLVAGPFPLTLQRLERYVARKARRLAPGLWFFWLHIPRSLLSAAMFLLSLASLASGTHNPFIYFNF